MIHTSRIPVGPEQTLLVQQAKAALAQPFPDGQTEYQKSVAYYNANPPPTSSYSFTRYGEHEVCVAIDALFNRKCAYCESSYSAVKARNVEHYRPKGEVAERNPSFPGYWWLASDWNNLLASCLPCNQRRKHTHYVPGVPIIDYNDGIDKEGTVRSGKANSFPLVGSNWITIAGASLATEDPLLIDPCDRIPANHLEWGFDWDRSQPIWKATPLIGFLKPKDIQGVPDPYAAASIRIYGLNRAGLMRDREARLLLIQGICRSNVTRIYQAAPADRAGRLNDMFDDFKSFEESGQPYAGMAAAFGKLLPGELKKYL